MGSEPRARVILDSLHPDGCSRLVTLEIILHRFVLPEFLTHRSFSRNSASSRAVPLAKNLARVREDPAVPLSFPAERRGMQGGEELDLLTRSQAEAYWRAAAYQAVRYAELLGEAGVHKSVVNRVLEPYLWHTVILTATESALRAFFDLRCSPLAQPEIRAAAEAMRSALQESSPRELRFGEWHLPLVTGVDLPALRDRYADDGATDVAKRVSAARCARVSYLTHGGVRDPEEDLRLAARLMDPGEGSPPHASPFEHVCTPAVPTNGVRGNLRPHWRQMRHELWP